MKKKKIIIYFLAIVVVIGVIVSFIYFNNRMFVYPATVEIIEKDAVVCDTYTITQDNGSTYCYVELNCDGMIIEKEYTVLNSLSNYNVKVGDTMKVELGMWIDEDNQVRYYPIKGW